MIINFSRDWLSSFKWTTYTIEIVSALAAATMLLRIRSRHQLAIAFFITLCLLANSAALDNLTCDFQDSTALNRFLDNLDSVIDGWGSSSGADCCTWTGVTCEFVQQIASESSSRVVSIVLTNKRLTGKLTKSIAGLDHLRVLNLSNNYFWDYLPVELFQFEFLEVLDLSSNVFKGNLTMEISLPSLKYLDLSHNLLDGVFNRNICGVARRLQVLDLSINYFTGEIPDTIGNCSFLEVLSLGSNYFTGNLPEDLLQLPMVRQLTIANNGFSGLLSPTLNNLSNIVELDISSNNFSGKFPDAFYNLRKLKRFVANSNRFTGSLPPSLSSSPSISTLNVRNNSLNGSIVLNCSSMISLTSVSLGYNPFGGSVPENLSSCRRLTSLDLSRIKFTSPLPESFKNMTSLSYLSLSNCSLQNLTATLAILQHCKNLSILVLTLNFRNEVMPADLNLQFNSLGTLVLANCQLTGLVPSWLESCTNLQLLDLSWNRLTGHIPNFFRKMKLLFYLDLSRNMLTEEVPIGLTELPSLVNQSITLQEPSEDFLFIKSSSNARTLQYNNIQRFPPSLDLSSNYLTGPILEEFGNLKQLHVLNLNNNSLSGHIPKTLSSISSLEALDLSNNNLSGTIPPSFANLNFLSKFSVAFNQLSGPIPTGGQFFTFPDSSFSGNKDLCGGQLQSCSSGPPEEPGDNPVESEDTEDYIVGLPLVTGGLTGFIIVVIICYLSGWLIPKEKKTERIEIAWQRMR